MGKLGSFAGGVAQGITRASNIESQQGQLQLQQQAQQQKQQQDLLTQASKRVEDAVTQSSSIMEQAHKKAALIENPAEKATLLDNARKAVDVLQSSVTKIDLGVGNDPAVLNSRFATIKEGIGISGEQQLEARGAGLEAGAKAKAVEEAVPTITKTQSRTAINPDTGEQRQAVFDPVKGKNFFTDTGEEVGPEFNVLSLTGKLTGEDIGLKPTPASTTDLQKKIVVVDDQIANLEKTMQGFNPDFLKLPTKLQVGALEQIEKLGIFGELSPENKELVTKMATFKQDAITTVNNTIRAITGAQMNQAEIPRITKQIPNLDDSPTVFIEKLKNSIKIAKVARARYKYLLTQGFNENDLSGQFSEGGSPSINLDKMEEILDRRVEDMRELNLSDDQIRAKLKVEFGI